MLAKHFFFLIKFKFFWAYISLWTILFAISVLSASGNTETYFYSYYKIDKG